MKKRTLIRIIALILILPIAGMATMSLFSQKPTNLGVNKGQLAPCPDSPNCVSSQADDQEHGMSPIKIEGIATETIDRLKKIMAQKPRTKLVTSEPNYLHYEVTSLIFRFVDDVEFFIDETEGVIHFRSASRVGRSDLGVNRQRMQEIQSAYEEYQD